jgi:peptidoglycan/LPS O-acetylase OafA/YrhL
MYAWGFTVVDAGVALMCVAVLDRRWLPGHLLRSPPFPWIGRLSYALYLWHPPVFVAVVTQAPEWPVGVKLVAGWAITFGFAIVSYYCVETPFLRLKGRLSSSAHGPQKAAQAAEPAASQA